jgi:hypothetical protein
MASIRERRVKPFRNRGLWSGGGHVPGGDTHLQAGCCLILGGRLFDYRMAGPVLLEGGGFRGPESAWQGDRSSLKQAAGNLRSISKYRYSDRSLTPQHATENALATGSCRKKQQRDDSGRTGAERGGPSSRCHAQGRLWTTRRTSIMGRGGVQRGAARDIRNGGTHCVPLRDSAERRSRKGSGNIDRVIELRTNDRCSLVT